MIVSDRPQPHMTPISQTASDGLKDITYSDVLTRPFDLRRSIDRSRRSIA